jgi:HEAT repeat protein/ABC-type oligopeptide transport system ATPase subunit
MTWDNFLDITADSYGLSDRQKQVFIARFSDQGANDSNARIAANLRLSEQDIERALREVYNLFKDDCLELASRTRGQAEKLRKWLKQKYAQEQQGQSVVIGSVSTSSVINWSAICREQNAKLRKSPTEEGFEPEIFVPLGLMERKQQQRRPLNQEMGMDQVYGVEEKAEITRKFEHQEFLTYIGLGGKEAENAKNVAIIGEPGAGKTTLLANLAQVIDEYQGLAIAISLGSFGAWQSLEPKRNLKDYLEQKWLEDALPDKNVSEADRVALGDRFRQGGVWLLLDGLDEMQASSPVEALAHIEQEVRSGYLQKARVVLTCRVNVWDANLSNPLREFETYKTLDFAEEQRDDFIRQWFTKKGNLALGKGLINQLKESGRERICELVKNPLRLVLLCYIWTQQAGELPETKAQFYQRYLSYFYEWKKEVRDLTQDDELQESLHQALAKLALAGIESDSRYRLPRKLARREMGQELFNLAVALGWLNIVDRQQGTDEAVYAFFHPTFQEFFAACGVTNWDFFLPRDHVDRPVEGKVYRIFEAKWKEVILLWLGRRDIKEGEKEAFIKALVTFDDGCGEWNFERVDRGFYEYRAYFLAALGVAEFKDCLQSETIIMTVIQYRFGFSNDNEESQINFIWPIQESVNSVSKETDIQKILDFLIHLLFRIKNKNILSEMVKYLENIGRDNEKITHTLIKLLQNPLEYSIYRSVIIILSKISKNNDLAFMTLSSIIYSTENKGLIIHLLDSLLETGNTKINIQLISHLIYLENQKSFFYKTESLRTKNANDQQIIQKLIEYIELTKDPYFRRKGIEYLGKIGNKKDEVIANLTRLLHNNNESDLIFLQILRSLEKVGQDSEQVIISVTSLLQNTQNELIRWKAAESLGIIDKGNKLSIKSLIQIIQTTRKQYTHLKDRAVESLSKIDPHNEESIKALMSVVQSTENEEERRKALKSLPKIATDNKKAVTALIQLLQCNQNTYTLRSVIKALGEIGKNNDQVIMTLLQILRSDQQENLHIVTMESLGNIAHRNQQVIVNLTKIINSTEDKWVLLGAIDSLGRVDPGNSQAMTTLIQIIESSKDEDILELAVDCLRQILQQEQMIYAVGTLRKYLIDETYDYRFSWFRDCYSVLWECAKNLPYPAFYQAWHHPPITPHPEVLDTTAIGFTALTQTLNLQLLPNELPNYCLYLDDQPLNAYTLPELSQELCNLIHQHLNQYPIPEANNLPQLKRHLLPLLAQHPQLTLIFGHAYPSDTLLTFCQQLNATLPIAWINDQTIPNLQTFSPQDPNLLEKILNWLNNAIGEQ